MAEEVDLEDLGHYLQAVRKRFRFSLRDLSRLTGISVTHIQRIEKGVSDISISRFVSLCTALGLVAGELLDDCTTFRIEALVLSDADLPQEWMDKRKRELLNSLWRFAIILIWTTRAVEKVQAEEFPYTGLKEGFLRYAQSLQNLFPDETRALYESLLSQPVPKLRALGLLPTNDDLASPPRITTFKVFESSRRNRLILFWLKRFREEDLT